MPMKYGGLTLFKAHRSDRWLKFIHLVVEFQPLYAAR
jgi:hypothetical protein